MPRPSLVDRKENIIHEASAYDEGHSDCYGNRKTTNQGGVIYENANSGSSDEDDERGSSDGELEVGWENDTIGSGYLDDK